MAKPILFVVDADRDELDMLKLDLEKIYHEHFSVHAESLADVALQTLNGLQEQNEPVALLLVEHSASRLCGTDFLQQAGELFPKAKRVLLVSYDATRDAVEALNNREIDYYTVRPLDTPQECLYPALKDLLEDWLAVFSPPYGRVRVIGHRWSPKSYEVKNFLARNQIPYQWFDLERQAEARELLQYVGASMDKVPVVIFADDTYLVEPTTMQIAEKIHLKVHAETRFYDLIIVGSGPAGLAAGVYGASEGLHTLMVEKNAPGGQAGTSSRIENYLGFPAGLSGGELARRGVAQALRFGVEMLTPQEVVHLHARGQYRIVRLLDGSEIACHALLIATGVSYRKLDVPGIENLNGAGVYYGAATTEGIACRDEEVYIVGGANSAGQAAIYFARYARKVIMLVRGPSLSVSMSEYLIKQIKETHNIEVRICTRIVSVSGETHLEGMTVVNDQTGERSTFPASSLFIFIGAMPHTDRLAGIVKRDAQGFILTGPDLLHHGHRPADWPLPRDPYLLETNIPGVFASGDVRHGSVKRVAAGVGEGAMAVQFIQRYLSEL